MGACKSSLEPLSKVKHQAKEIVLYKIYCTNTTFLNMNNKNELRKVGANQYLIVDVIAFYTSHLPQDADKTRILIIINPVIIVNMLDLHPTSSKGNDDINNIMCQILNK